MDGSEAGLFGLILFSCMIGPDGVLSMLQIRLACEHAVADGVGCTAHQIKAVGGWSTLKEVERYTRAANQASLARSAIASIKVRNAVQDREEV
ncbi:hypothetical protein AA11826_0092 [Komagataeibacter oboediens DSM 11826]|nr:hypothetical protein [Komagataeibacter oboediens]GBR27507.1 hypothetical protein AA11826_0092 [Komagataeibacter oboediens DSM 11826]